MALNKETAQEIVERTMKIINCNNRASTCRFSSMTE